MRILVIADPHVPVPPQHYGGTERVCHMMCQGLAASGHTVDLIAGAGSQRYGGRLHVHTAPSRRYVSRALRKIWFQTISLRAGHHADLIVTFGRPDYLWALYRTRKPIVVQFGNPLDQAQIDQILAHRRHRLQFVGVSRDHVSGLVPTQLFNVIYNAVETERFKCRLVADDPPYVAFLGRLTENKGVHLAIAAARQSGIRLKIAGNVSQTESGAQVYYADRVKPELDQQIEYIGPVDDAAKGQLLGGAAALLFPIQWREPFGIVMAEALACGCPVIAWRNGSVPEIVRHGETGYIVDSVDDMAAAIRRIGEIDRAACRRDAEERFSPQVLVDGYLSVIEKAFAG